MEGLREYTLFFQGLPPPLLSLRSYILKKPLITLKYDPEEPLYYFLFSFLTTFKPPTVVAKLSHLPFFFKQVKPLPQKKAYNKNQKLIFSNRGVPSQGPQYSWQQSIPQPPIKMAIIINKIRTKAWALTMALKSWSSSHSPGYPRFIYGILRPVPSVAPHAPVINYKVFRFLWVQGPAALSNSFSQDLYKHGPL